MAASTTAPTRWLRLLALLTIVGLTAAACGGGDDGGGGDAGGADTTTPAGDPDEGETPVYGGTVVFGRESETRGAWAPATTQCDLSCHAVAQTVYDTLTYLGEDEEPHPFLLESIEPDADHTVWTLTAREGITFHDGTPFDADAVVDHLDRMRAAPLAGQSLTNITDHTKVDDRTVEVTVAEPWVDFPYYLSGGPGYVASPTWLAAVDAGEADPAEPVGTGPFVFAEYNLGDNFRATRNDDYWLTDADGNPYPYLDEIEFIVLEEDQTRERALVAGDIDLTHTEKGDSILNLREQVEAGSLGMYEITDRPETSYAMINVADEDSPVADVRIRRAMALATDQELRNEARVAGVPEVANGPFAPGTTGHLEDNGWPDYDPDQARALVEEYKADEGVDEVRIRFNTTADPDNRLTVELLQQLWSEVGIVVDIAQLEQAELINANVNGDFEVTTWRRHGGSTPDLERVWWHSETSGPVGEIAINFGRIEDDVIDEALDTVRGADDPAVAQEAAETISRRFAEQVYNVWFDWVFWAIPHQNRVHGVQTPLALPDGTAASTRSIGTQGGIGMAQLWVDDTSGS